MRDGKDFEIKIGASIDKVANPVLSDLALDLSAFGAYDVYPKRLPRPVQGPQLVVMGRYRTPKDGTVVLTGSFNGKKQVFEYRGAATKESKAVRLRSPAVGDSQGRLPARGDPPARREARAQGRDVALGKKFGIVTPYTSYLVVEDVPMPVAQNQNGRRLRLRLSRGCSAAAEERRRPEGRGQVASPSARLVADSAARPEGPR